MCAVEWKKLGDVCSFQRGSVITEKDAIPGDVPVLSGGQKPAYYHNQFNRKGETIVVAGSGAYAGFVSFWDIPVFLSDSFSVNPNDILNIKYVFYFLKNIQDKIFATKKGSGVPHVHGSSIAKFDIPIPSLAKQQEIVSHLDTFTTLISNLESELDMRRKQYEHYRNQLLDFEGVEGVEWKTLGDVCEIRGRIGFRGYTREDQVEEGEGVLSLSPGNIVNGKMDYNNSTYITWQKYEESPEIKTYDGDIIFCKTGSTVGKVSMVNKLPYKATINPQLVVLKEITINPKFLFYTLGTFRIQSLVKALAGVGSVPNISQAKLSEFKIYIPSTKIQQEIVEKLDAFENLIQSLEEEIKLRKQQYEYYREKLLTFEKE